MLEFEFLFCVSFNFRIVRVSACSGRFDLKWIALVVRFTCLASKIPKESNPLEVSPSLRNIANKLMVIRNKRRCSCYIESD